MRLAEKLKQRVRSYRNRRQNWHNLDDIIRRRVAVEQYLFDCVEGKRPLPDAETCRLLALKLGTPSEAQKIKLPKKPER